MISGQGISAVRERWAMSVEARALVLLTAVILSFGLAVLYSASSIVAMEAGRGSAFFLVRQLSGVLLGAMVFAFAAKMDAERWWRMAWPLMIGAIVLTLLTIVLPESIAPTVHGSRRFLFGSSFQPSEFAKLAVVIWTSMLVVRKRDQMRRFSKGMLPFVLVIGLLDLLVMLEPDLSQAMFFTLVMSVILFAGGARIGHFIVLGLIAAPLLYERMSRVGYALARMTSFFQRDPAKEVTAIGYQLQQSLIAVGSGRVFGVGFGAGHQQYGFLPFPYSDFIASNIGEEWGFAGMLFIILAFVAYGTLGYRIAMQARSPFLQLVALGLTFTTVLTAFVHIGVVIGLLPTTGLTLPLVSYGRSNLVLSLLMTGILVNIGSERARVVGEFASDPLALAA